LEPGTLKTHSDPSKTRNVTKNSWTKKKFMSLKWLLRLLMVGRAKLLTSAENNINILSLYKHKKTDILN